MKLRRLMYYTTSAMVVVIFFSSNSYGRKTSCSYPEPDPYGPIYLPIYDELDDETLKSLQKCPVKQEFVRETQCTINENGNCELSGAILKDTILTLRKSPYEVVGDFQVPPGLKLRIQPGVKVYFNEDSRILVQGAIKAVGTETKKILFTSVTGGTLSRGTMIEFYNTNLYNQLLEYIIFSYGSKTLFLNDNPIDQATQNIGTLRSNHLEFINNVKNVDSNNNIVLNNMRATEGSMKIYAWGLTTFISIDHAILTNVQFYINNTLKIENSTLNNVGYEGLRTEYGGELDIDKSSIIIGDKILHMYFGTISNSEIKSDGTHDGIIIYYIPYINGEEIILTITNNNIFNFKTAIKLITPGDPMFKYEENWIGIHNNNIYNNTDYNIMNEYYTDIDATNNYWGTADEEEIQEKIYDYLDNDELRTVIYDPYMTSPIQF